MFGGLGLGMGSAPMYGNPQMGPSGYGNPQMGYPAAGTPQFGAQPVGYGPQGGPYGSQQPQGPGKVVGQPGTTPPGAVPPSGASLSQPPPVPEPQKLYVRTTAIESAATMAATTHISFLWTMMALAGGVALGLSCGLYDRFKNKKKGEEEEKEGDDDSSSSSSDSE